MADGVRIDKWLWAVRVFKTRSVAADACKKGRVSILNASMKPSHFVSVGDVLNVRKGAIVFSFKVLALSQNRMGARLVPDYCQNVTAKDQMDMLEMQRLGMNGMRQRGTGRPTKKERRDMDTFTTELDDDWELWNLDDEE